MHKALLLLPLSIALLAACSQQPSGSIPAEQTAPLAVQAVSTGDAALTRGKVWVDQGIAYDQGAYSMGYRQDCSGFVSYAWQLSTSATTVNMSSYAHQINIADLRPGDALNNQRPGNAGHIVLFVRWVNPGHTFVAYEENGGAGKTIQSTLTLIPMSGGGVTIQEYQYDAVGPWIAQRSNAIPDSAPSLSGNGQRVARGNDGTLRVTARGSDGNVWSRAQNGQPGGWQDWLNQGRPNPGLAANPTSGINADGRQELFVTAQDGQVYHRWQDAQGVWSGWYPLDSLAGASGDVTVQRDNTQRLHVFVKSGGAIFTDSQQAQNGSWSGWKNLGGSLPNSTGLATGINSDGHLEVFGVDAAGALQHAWSNPEGTAWSAVYSMADGATVQGTPVSITNSDGYQYLFALGTNGHLYERKQSARNAGWNAWRDLGVASGGLASNVTAGLGPDGRAEAFVLGADGALYHRYESATGSDSWGSSFDNLGGAWTSGVAAGRNTDGHLEVFGRRTDGGPQHLWQNLNPIGWSQAYPFNDSHNVNLSGF